MKFIDSAIKCFSCNIQDQTRLWWFAIVFLICYFDQILSKLFMLMNCKCMLLCRPETICYWSEKFETICVNNLCLFLPCFVHMWLLMVRSQGESWKFSNSGSTAVSTVSPHISYMFVLSREDAPNLEIKSVYLVVLYHSGIVFWRHVFKYGKIVLMGEGGTKCGPHSYLWELCVYNIHITVDLFLWWLV